MEVTLFQPTIDEHSNPDGSGTVHVTASWTVSGHTARRRANGVIIDRIGGLIAREPYLVIGERVVWRVPVEVAFKELGTIGQAGTIDIDANTAEPLITDEQIRAIKKQATLLAKRTLAATA